MPPSNTRLLAPLLLAISLLLFTRPAFCDDTPPETAAKSVIYTVLKHGDTILACTTTGFYGASAKDKSWRKLETPPEMHADFSGRFVQQSPDSPLLAYYVETDAMVDDLKNPPALFISKDSGKTWKQASAGHNFTDIFIHPNGDIYAFEVMGSHDERLLLSKDAGVTWKDISANFPRGLEFYHLFQDPDHPELACFQGSASSIAGRPFVFQAADATYQWKRIELSAWNHDPWANSPTSSVSTFVPGIPPPTLSNYFSWTYFPRNEEKKTK